MKQFTTLGEWTNRAVIPLQKETIYLKNPEELKLKLQRTFEEGREHLQIATDFDQTISSFYYNGKHSLATFSIFRTSEYSPESFRTKMTEYLQYYQPIEKDQSVKFEEKNRLMNEWYHKVSEQFKEAKFTKEQSNKILNTSNISIRALFEDFFKQCQQDKIPFHIVSGGLDIICQTILNTFQDLNQYPELTLNANELIFEDDLLVRMEMKVTATSKSQVLANSGLDFKNNTLLLGDLPSDYYMTSQLNLPNQISIGFIPDSHIDQLGDHTKLFDITIMGDGSYLIPLMIVLKTCKIAPSDELIKLFNQQEYEELRSLM